MTTFVWPSIATEVLAIVTATDSASRITGELGPLRMDIYLFCFIYFIQDAEETIVYKLLNLHSQEKSTR